MNRLSMWVTATAVVAAATTAVLAPAAAQAGPDCGVRWGSLDKGTGDRLGSSLINVRAGQHPCYDRLVLDFAGGSPTFHAGYVPAVTTQGKGDVLPLRGGAFVEIVVKSPDYDVNTGAPTYSPADCHELVNVSGWRTFRQVAEGGSFEGYTTIGLGVRARLPFRVFTLPGPGTHSRLVIDVAHHWVAP